MTGNNIQEVGLVFGIGRRKTRGELVRAEFGESLDHLIQAASHAAGGVGATMGPRVLAAKDYVSPATGKVRDAAAHSWTSTVAAVAPIAAAAAEGAREAGGVGQRATSTNLKAMRKANLRAMRKKESQMSRKRWPTLAGLLAAGAAVGAAGAMVRRRRKEQEWDEYDPGRPLEPMPGDPDPMTPPVTDDPLPDAAGSMASAMDTGMNAGAEKISSSAGAVTDGAKQAVKQKTESAAGKATATGEVLSKASSPSRNSRS